MDPSLALIFSILFVFCVYWKDSKTDPQISSAIWIPIIWIMRCASRSFSYWFEGTGGSFDFEEGSIPDQIFFILSMIAAILVLKNRLHKLRGFIANNHALLLFFLYCLLSVLWSQYWEVSFKRWVRTIGDLLMVLVILSEDNPAKSLGKAIRKVSILLIPLSVVFIKYFPNVGRMTSKDWGPDMWIGVATHKNTLGQLLLLSGLYYLLQIIKIQDRGTRILTYVYLVMIAYLFYGGSHSVSMTSLVLLFLVIAIYFIINRNRLNPARNIKIMKSIFALVFCYTILSTFFADTNIFILLAESLGKDPTMAGRTIMWSDLISIGIDHAIQGSGFGGFWTPSMMAKLKLLHPWGPQQAHNGYIEIFLNLGLIGLVLFFLIVISACRNTFLKYEEIIDYSNLRIVLLIIALVHNVTESSFTRPTHLIWFVFLLGAINISFNKKENLPGVVS